MSDIYQIIVEGKRDIIVLKRLLCAIKNIPYGEWKRLEEKTFYHALPPNGDHLLLRELGGYTGLERIVSEFSRAKALGDGKITKNLIILDADTPATGGGFATRNAWVTATLNAIQAKAEVVTFLLPDNASDGTLETLLLGARTQVTSNASLCLQALDSCLKSKSVPYPLTEKIRVSLYAWLFDKDAAKSFSVDDAVQGNTVFDFASNVFAPLCAFLRTNLP